MTNFEKLGAVRQAASEKLFHIIIEAHEAGRSAYQDPDFSECLAIVQGVEIATQVAHKFDEPSPVTSNGDRSATSRPDQLPMNGETPQVNENAVKPEIASPAVSGDATISRPHEEHLEGKSFQVNQNTLTDGDRMEGDE
jgi:hypothetical protein